MKPHAGRHTAAEPGGLSPKVRPLGVRFGLPVSLGVLGLFSACGNQPPQIDRVGDFVIANSLGDYVDPSVVDSPSFEVKEGETIRVEFLATDPEGEVLSWSAGPLPLGASFDAELGVLEWTVFNINAISSSYELYVVVKDPDGLWDSVIVYLQAYTETESDEQPLVRPLECASESVPLSVRP